MPVSLYPNVPDEGMPSDRPAGRPEGPFRERERQLWDQQNPDTDEVLRQLERLVKSGSDPLVHGLDARHVASIADLAQRVIVRQRAALRAKEAAGP